MLTYIAFLLWIIWQIYIIHLFSMLARFLYQKIWWEIRRKTFIFIIFGLVIFSCVFSLIFAELFLINLSIICLINGWGECWSLWWAIFAFFIISPIIGVITGISGYIYSKKQITFWSGVIGSILLLFIIFSSISFFIFISNKKEEVLKQKRVSEQITKTAFACNVWFELISLHKI